MHLEPVCLFQSPLQVDETSHFQSYWSHGLRVSVLETSPDMVSQSCAGQRFIWWHRTAAQDALQFQSLSLCLWDSAGLEGDRAAVCVWSSSRSSSSGCVARPARAAYGDTQDLPQKVTSAEGNFLTMTQDLKMTTLKIYISVSRITWYKLRAVNCWVKLC